MDTKDFSFRKYQSNFESKSAGYLSHEYYDTSNIKPPMQYHISHNISLRFECDSGLLNYYLSTFPGNCGISVYSTFSVNSKSYKSDQDYIDNRNIIFSEFIEYIKETSPNNLIMITDRIEGKFHSFVESTKSEDKFLSISTPVYNRNSSHRILVYLMEANKGRKSIEIKHTPIVAPLNKYGEEWIKQRTNE